MDKIKVLVIDDKKIIGDLFDFTLGFSGHQVKWVQTSFEAINLVKSENFDIAFLDIVMPDRDGVDTLEAIKLVSPDLPVVMMSGYSVDEKRDRSKELGAITCLKKPFEMDEIRQIVRTALGKEI